MADDDEVLSDSEGNAVLNPRIREQLRNQEQQLKETTKRLRDAELRAVFTELGIPSTGLAKLFRDGYQGEPTLEAVKSAASEYDGLLPTATTTLDSQQANDLEALRRINNASDTTNVKDATEVLQETLTRLRNAKDLAEYDEIMASPEVQALRSQPISFN